MIRMYSPVAPRMPLFTAAPLPLLYGCRITRAPAAAARALVSSVEPSSTTSTSRQRAAERRALDDLANRASLVVRGNDDGDGAGIGHLARRPPPSLARPDRARRTELHPAHAVQEVFEQLARARDRVGDEPDQHDLEADDHQHRGQNQGLNLAFGVRA